MRQLDASPRVLLKLPFAIRLGIAVLSVVIVLFLFMVLPLPARTPSMLAIPMAIVAWMFRKRGALICLASMVLVLWLFYAYKVHHILLPGSTTTSFIAATLALVIVGILVSLLRDAMDWVDAARVETAHALEQQRKLNQAKDQLIMNVNHELRTPLTAISGYIDLLIHWNDRIDNETRLKHLKNMQDSCDDLQELIGNVLDALQVDMGKEHLTIQRFSVLDAVREILAHSNPAWLQSHRVHVDICEKLTMQANKQYFRQVLRNLLSNAFRYVPAGTEVFIIAHPWDEVAPAGNTASQVCIKVQDTGPGIPPDELPNLFGQFARLERDLSGPVRGSGLGLYISKQMVESMGGRIWVESTGVPGQGSCFSFTLPAGISPALINAIAEAESIPFVSN
jgi:signal transduction histidine kinase